MKMEITFPLPLWRQNKKRRKEFFGKKEEASAAATTAVKKENEDSTNNVKASLDEPKERIVLAVYDAEINVDTLFKIEGEFRNPSFKPWEVVDPNKEVKILWDLMEKDDKITGIEEIGDESGSLG